MPIGPDSPGTSALSGFPEQETGIPPGGRIPPILLKLLLAAFLVRIAVVIPAHIGGFGADEKEFLYLAHQLAEGRGFVDSNGEHSVRAPLFPALLALFIPLTGSSLVIPFLLVAFLGMVNVYAGYRLAWDIWKDSRAATAAAALIAFFPALVLHGALLMSETLFIALFLHALLLARRLQTNDRMVTHLVFGAVSALAVLTRAVFFGVFPLLIIALFLKRRKAHLPSSRLLIAVVVWCALLLPWTARNYSIHHAWIPVSTFGGRSLLIGFNPFAHGTTKLDPGFQDWLDAQLQERGFPPYDSLSEQQLSSAEQTVALHYVAAHPLHAALLSLEKTYVFWIYPLSHRSQQHLLQASLMAFDVLLGLALIGGILVARQRGVSMFPLWLVLLFFTLMHAILHAEARYRLPLVPLLCIIGAGCISCRDREFLRSLVRDARAKTFLLASGTLLVVLYAIAAFLAMRGLA